MIGRIAHLSDIHFGTENAPAVQRVLEDLHRAPPQLVVITGDITAVGATDEFDRAAAWARALPEPQIGAPGNHDAPYAGVGDLLERLVDPFRRWRARFGDLDGGWSGEGLDVAWVNTARGVQMRANWSKGAISARQASAAVEALSSRSPGALSVVACHHPLVEMTGGPMTGAVHGGEAAARQFCEAGVDLILTGHVHAPFAMALPYGDGRTIAAGAATLSTRERGAPAGYNLIEWTDDEIRIVAQGWKGSHFEPWRTWSLPRRG